MRNRIDIDHIHSWAIVREIGERLRASLEPEPELSASLRAQIDRLRELEAAERWNKPRGSAEPTAVRGAFAHPPIITVGELIDELCRLPDSAAVHFRCPMLEQ